MSAARGLNRGSALHSPRAPAGYATSAWASLTGDVAYRARHSQTPANFPHVVVTSSNLGTAAFGKGRPRRMNYDLYDRLRASRCPGAERALLATADGAHG